ncbi:hypothetical protein TTRE_0000890001, partial [Trichuris trichiura]
MPVLAEGVALSSAEASDENDACLRSDEQSDIDRGTNDASDT